jgi:hypothetical protein
MNANELRLTCLLKEKTAQAACHASVISFTQTLLSYLEAHSST